MKTLLSTNHTKVVVENGREMIVRPVAVAIIAFTPDNEVIMVKQERGGFGKILEVPAGKVDKGEDPDVAVVRELLEETGYKAEHVNFLMDYFPSVGYSTEIIRCYYSENITDTGIQRLDDNERIEIVKIPVEELYEKIYNGEIKDSKTIMCMWSALLKHMGMGN